MIQVRKWVEKEIYIWISLKNNYYQKLKISFLCVESYKTMGLVLEEAA
jgi:hypothetical protein